MIKKNKVVSFDYEVKDNTGKIIDGSGENGPLVYIHGNASLLPALESALEGKNLEETFSVVVLPEQAYGQRNEELLQVVDRSVFEDIDEVKEGMVFNAQQAEGELQVTVIGIEGNNITLDGNHPLAGITLNFEGVVRDVRDATPEEIKRGDVIKG